MLETRLIINQVLVSNILSLISKNMTINEVQDEIVDEFSLFDNRNDIYEYIIEMGKKLPDMPDQYRVDENLIKGCQSKVWLQPLLVDGKVKFEADSDSTLVKGLVALLVRVLSDRTPAEVAAADLYFIKQIGMEQLLTSRRSNSFTAMVSQMKTFAVQNQAA